MNNTGPRTDRMGREISSLAIPFKKVLLSFADGDISFTDAQSDLQRLLAAGASPDDLREVMRRCELMEPLPGYAHQELLRILNAVTASAAAPRTEVGTAGGTAASTPPALTAGPASDTRPRPRAVEPPLATLEPASIDAVQPAQRPGPALAIASPTPPITPADRAKSLERRIARQKADYQELTHTYERARDAGSAAAARAIAVGADLSAVRNALEVEQSKNRDSSLALADAAVANEAALAALAARDGILAAQDATLAARDATIADLHRELGERETNGGARLESALAAERAQTAAVDAQLVQAQAALEVEQNLNRDGERALAEAAAAHKAVSAALAGQEATVAALGEQLAQRQSDLDAEMAAAEAARRALADSSASLDAARGNADEAARTSAGYQSQMMALNEALASRDAQLGQLRGELAERDTLLGRRQLEHAQAVAGLEARLQTLDTDLASAQATVDQEQRKAREALAEQAAAAQTVRAQGEAARREHAGIVAALERRANTLESELLGAKRRVDAVPITPIIAAAPVASVELVPAPEPPVERAVDPPTATALLEPSLWSAEPAAVLRPEARTATLRWPAGTPARAAGVGGAVLLLILLIWSVSHHASAPATEPAIATIPDPAPGTVIRDCPTCPALTVVPAGRFKQGSLRADSVSAAFERPLHWVLINHAFAMSTNAVSVDEFRVFAAATGRDMRGCDVYDEKWHVRSDAGWESPGFAQTGAHPVTCVSWDDATAYAQWLSKSTGHHFRLPSASEWEYAARAGSEAGQPWSSDGAGACTTANVADQQAAKKYPGWAVFTCDDGYVYTAPGGSFKANAFGLNDMLGNVFQWTQDCWHADYTGAPSDGSARTSGDCAERELRGGSWFTTPSYVRATYRNHFGVGYRSSTQGIRLVRDITP